MTVQIAADAVFPGDGPAALVTEEVLGIDKARYPTPDTKFDAQGGK